MSNTEKVERDIFQPLKITLIDDVLNKGSTVFAGARLLHEHFPEAEIRAFALFLTQGLIPEIETDASMVDSAHPCPVEPGFEIAENTVDLRDEPMDSLGDSNQTSSC